MMDQKFMRRTMILSHKKTMHPKNMITMIRMDLLKIDNGNLSQMICKLLIYRIIMMVPMV